jgi:dihydropteroate synthase
MSYGVAGIPETNMNHQSILHTSRGPVDLSGRPRVMGVLNVTPDSFSDGGRFLDPAAAVEHGLRMVADGADWIDVGGESTRPGSGPVAADEQVRRVVPVIAGVAAASAVPISIDTTDAGVAEAALAAGACLINDVSALRFDPRMAALAAKTGAAVCLMHMLGEPRTMQRDPQYEDVTAEVCRFLADRVQFATGRGIAREAIVIDPGIGFGKTREHNLTLMRRLDAFAGLGVPLLVGTSRKRFIGDVLGLPVGERQWGTAATVAWAVSHGARIVRVHDVFQMRQVVAMTWAMMSAADG